MEKKLNRRVRARARNHQSSVDDLVREKRVGDFNPAGVSSVSFPDIPTAVVSTDNVVAGFFSGLLAGEFSFEARRASSRAFASICRRSALARRPLKLSLTAGCEASAPTHIAISVNTARRVRNCDAAFFKL